MIILWFDGLIDGFMNGCTIVVCTTTVVVVKVGYTS